ncbi:MAG: hypothetical protein AMK75_05180 [Planctomycetes bacterium SM23_65]|nr:MAG: hypothetical protein AMK75_05180 [Planctomycetes bacterium SM23_65]
MSTVGEHPEGMVFIEATYSYRSWGVYAATACFGLFGGVLWYAVIRMIIVERASLPLMVWGTLFVGGIGTLLLGMGVFFACRAIRGRTYLSRIDASGITAEGKHCPWRTITWIGPIRDEGTAWMLSFRENETGGRHLIWAGRSLSKRECHAVLHRLRPFLAERHPHVQVGGV